MDVLALSPLRDSAAAVGTGASRRDAASATATGSPSREVAVLIVMRHGATEDEVRRVIAVIEEMGYKARPMPGVQRTAVGLVGNDGRVDASRLEGLPASRTSSTSPSHTSR